MNCRRVDSLLSDHLEGLLSPRQERAVTEHLAGCPVCRQRREQLRAVGADLRAAEQGCRPPDLLNQSLDRWLAARETAPAHRRAAARWIPWGRHFEAGGPLSPSDWRRPAILAAAALTCAASGESTTIGVM